MRFDYIETMFTFNLVLVNSICYLKLFSKKMLFYKFTGKKPVLSGMA